METQPTAARWSFEQELPRQFLDPYFELRDHANGWDVAELWYPRQAEPRNQDTNSHLVTQDRDRASSGSY